MLKKSLLLIVKTLFKLTFVAALFVLLFRPETFGFAEDKFNNISPQSLWTMFTEDLDLGTAVFWLGFATFIKFAGISCGVIRWRILLRAQGIHIPTWYLVKCWFWGRALGLLAPGTLGLDGYRLVESSRYTGEVIKCTTVIAVEKLTGFIALFTLVFFTVPLGLRLFNFNLPVLAAVLLALGAFITTSILLLLQPRIIQILVSILPVPGLLRTKVNEVGLAVTAYSAHRGALFLALGFGLCVHLAICLVYFGTASAIRAANTGLLDILFASPLIIVASVFTPTVSGAGVRELVMTTLLGGTAGAGKAFLFAHLGMWFGEVIPFLISLPLLLFTDKPNREALLADAEAVRAEAARRPKSTVVHLAPHEVIRYRDNILFTLCSGALGGAVAGALIGILEAAWIARTLSGLDEVGLFHWGFFAYTLLFAGAGLGAAAGLLFFYLLLDRFAAPLISYAVSFAGTLLAGGLAIGLFRYRRDVLGEMMPSAKQLAQLVSYELGIVLLLFAVVYVLGAVWLRISRGRVPQIAGGYAAQLALLLVAALVLARVYHPEAAQAAFTPQAEAKGPNIFLVAVDTLRADYLPFYNAAIETKTPQLEAFLQDAIQYEHGYSQASWTKASFGTIFSGMYPECHTATTKTASLPQDVETLAEQLYKSGYYTQGYSNNPNIASIFGYGQGFVEYVDLKPSLLFGASYSASKLSMYEVLRQARARVDRAIKRKIRVEEYYQPAPVVTDTVLSWIDGKPAPEGTPFLLFAHFMDPHDPYMDPESPDGGYARKRMENPNKEEYHDRMRKAYIGEIELFDREFGRFIQGLKERGLYEDAAIVLTADHGEEFYEHGGWWHGLTLYEEQTHVPYLVKLPKNAHGGTKNPQIARSLDIAPSLLQLAGAQPGPMMQGKSLFDADGQPVDVGTAYSYAENDFEGIVLQSVRTPSTKLIKANEGNKRNLKPFEFYNLDQDTGEQHNLAEDPAWQVQREALYTTINDFLHICEEGAVEPAGQVVVDESLQEELRSLGYVE
ncbi:MAG: sulfatase-like hydrolase/transferase [Candidatus Hydrogenedentes bacterium]|nr:sulfatase-like hydrolase/transferase [Candidatus Hydrogenedentota bacterium]